MRYTESHDGGRLSPAVLGALVGWLLSNPLAWGADFTPGARDSEVVATLQGIAQALPLRTTVLADIAPEFVLPTEGNLTWEQALAEAGRRYGQRQPERALFLRPYVPMNASDADLDQLGWPRGNGVASVNGSSRFNLWWEWRGLKLPIRPLKIRTHHENTLTVEWKNPVARIGRGGGQDIAGWATLVLFDEKPTGGQAQLTFDGVGRLIVVTIVGEPDASGVSFRYTHSAFAAGRFSAHIAFIPPGAETYAAYEMLDFAQDLVMTKRTVTLRGSDAYREIYEAGKLRQRIHFGSRWNGQAHESPVERVENFP